MSSPLTRNDLQGSKMLINFCDSAFTIGESQQESRVRYLKQIKARSTEVKYHSENVCVCAVKKAWNYLCFEWLRQGAEAEHLRREQEASASSRIEVIASMKEGGMSNVAIAEALGVTETAVRKWLKKQDQSWNLGSRD
ncbi:MAG: helix-turn-helix domain-containing protein [Roseivirga sp.]